MFACLVEEYRDLGGRRYSVLLLATLFLDHSAPLHSLGLGAVLTTGFERRYLVLVL